MSAHSALPLALSDAIPTVPAGETPPASPLAPPVANPEGPLASPPSQAPIHFAVLCPDMQGHLNPMLTLARELRRRGHRLTFYLPASTRTTAVEGEGFGFRAFAEEQFTPAATAEDLRRLAALSGLKALKFTIELIRRRAVASLERLPALFRQDGIEALVCDQVLMEGGTVAEEVGVPYVTVCNALMLHAEAGVPPFFTPFAYRDSAWGRLRNQVLHRLGASLSGPVRREVNARRRARGLRPYRRLDDSFSPLAQVSQQPAELDFPRRRLPACFHYAGPFHAAAARRPVDFPFDRLDGRPMVYASMGTLQNGVREVFGKIAEACATLPVQLVISLGGGARPQDLGPLAGDPVVVGFAPQLELLRRCTLCITHAGLNTALEALAQGVPMVAMPVTNDQPGVAARLAYAGCAECLPLRKLTAARLREAVRRVLEVPAYRDQARRLQAAIHRGGGAAGAAAVIERAVTSTPGRPTWKSVTT